MDMIIINADDCGISKSVDNEIEKYIQQGKITSTTIMANMDDFEGACLLYAKYKDVISFGAHLNLTEGKPLTDANSLLEIGLAERSDDGIIYFCGNKLRKYHFNRYQREIIYNELDAQISKIINAGIEISHIDSHHHIHTDFWILVEVLKLAKKYNILKIMAINNYGHKGISSFLRKCWRVIVHCLYPSVTMTDYFTSYTLYIRNQNQQDKSKGSIELMTHPGGYDDAESKIMSSNKPTFNSSLITYKEL